VNEVFDYVIVGAGSAGCVLALRLAEAGKTVCVLEAGPADINPYIHIPAGYVKNIFSKTLTWNFISEDIPEASGRRISLTQGRVVGGSSSINGMVYNRGQHADYNSWAQKGNLGWSYDDVLLYFKKSETRIGFGEEKYRGREGPLTISDPIPSSPLCGLFVEAAKSCGFPVVPDHNGAAQDGIGDWQFTIDTSGHRPMRMSAARAFMRPALKTKNVSLRTNSPALRILFKDGRATGVRYRRGGPSGTEKTVSVRSEVILSAGAINTPRLLQISGIGQSDLVKSLGVQSILDLHGVGENLSDHFQLRVSARVKDIPTINERGRGFPLIKEISKWVLGMPSILSMGPVPQRLFFRSDPALEHPDLQISFTPGSYQDGLPGLLDHFPGMTLGGHKQRPESRGYVRATSTSIDVQPLIQPNYLSTKNDQAGMVAVVRMARKILGTPAFARHYVQEIFPGAEIKSDNEILDFARQRGGTAYHHTGTAKMGPDGDKGAVVDSQLRVYGIRGLRVADASIMPSPISGPTNAACIMIGEKASDMILSQTA